MSNSILTTLGFRGSLASKQLAGQVSNFGLFHSEQWLNPRGKFTRYLFSGVAVLALLTFLSLCRWFESRVEAPDTTIRLLAGVDAIQLDPPPPPPPTPATPPPPKTPPLPKLDIQINSPAPAIKATTDLQITPRVTVAEFSTDQPQTRQRMTFSLRDLDQQPRLLYRPRITFPSGLRARGLNEGRVTLEVDIGTTGSVTVVRVIESNDPAFTTMATDFASRARFSPPKKDGRPVATRFHWPIILR